MRVWKMVLIMIGIAFFASCEQAGYSMRGGQFSGAQTFSVEYFTPKTPLATQEYAQRFTESFKDLMLSQSPLDFVANDGELQFEGSIIGYDISYAGVQSDETTSSNRMTITVVVKYINTKEQSLSFDKKVFSASADFDGSADVFSVQESLWEDINLQLAQNIYNSTVGNW